MRIFRFASCFISIATAAPGQAFVEWRDLVLQATGNQTNGEFELAEILLNRALTVAERMGDHDMEAAVPVTFNNLGMLYSETGRKREAERAYKQAIARFETLGRKGAEMLVTPVANLIALYLETGQTALAATELRRLEGTTDSELSAGNQVRLSTARGRVLQTRRQYAEAEEQYRRALAIAENSRDISPLDLGNALNNLGTVEADLDRGDAATAHLQRALAVFESAGGSQSRHLVLPLMNLAIVMTACLNRPADSVAHLERASAIAERTFGPKSPDMARVLTLYASALRAAGRKREAKKATARARAIESVNGPVLDGRHTIDVNALRSGR